MEPAGVDAFDGRGAAVAQRDTDDYLERVPVRVDEQVTFVDVGDIVWIKANRNVVELHLADRVHELRETMASLAERLDPKQFARVHRAAIIEAFLRLV